MGESRYCSKCGKTMTEAKFYTYKDGSKCELCKSCLTMHINNYEPDTFMQLLEKFDVPYIEAEWKVRRGKEFDNKYNKVLATTNDPEKAREAAYNLTRGSATVFGRYLSQMKLKQQKSYGQKDTEFLKEKAEVAAAACGANAEEYQKQIDEMRDAYERGEISEAQFMTYSDYSLQEAPPSAEEQFLEEKEEKESRGEQVGGYTGEISNSPYPVNDHPFVEVDIGDAAIDLTDEDKLYLAMKQGRLYSANDWVSLEKLYNEFMESFDIQGAARIDTLKKICKTSLKMEQAIDVGDVDSYQKLSRVYDALMKSGKFTEAQRKEEKSGNFDSVGQIVYYAEKLKGKIPRHEITYPLDMVDKAINDLKKYNHDLVVNDPTLSQMFENFIKRREIAQQQREDMQKAEEEGLDYIPLTDADFVEMQDQQAEQKALDEKEVNES